MSRRKLYLVSGFAVWLLLWPLNHAEANFFVSNFDDCLISGMLGVGNDQAANVVMGDCWRKFPEGSKGPEKSSGLFRLGPNSWSECILKYMPGIESDRAAHGIRGACSRKFPIQDDLLITERFDDANKQNVRECVLRHGKATTSKTASLAIMGACRRREHTRH